MSSDAILTPEQIELDARCAALEAEHARLKGDSLDAEKRGVVVHCIVCGYIKKPVGRDASMLGPTLCDDECPGYRQQPYPGSLWPFESEAEFGYPVSNDATTKGGAR